MVTFFHMVIGEMVPKNMAIARPAAAALLLGPVRNDDGTLVGYIHTKDLLGTPAERRNGLIPRNAIRQLTTVPPEAKLQQVVRSMQANNAHFALIAGAGTRAGEASIVALEDVLEELVGEVRDATSAAG